LNHWLADRIIEVIEGKKELLNDMSKIAKRNLKKQDNEK
jgi:hypothetical protein